MTLEKWILQQFEKFTFKTEEQVMIDKIEQQMLFTVEDSIQNCMNMNIINLLKISHNKKMLELINFIVENYDWLIREYKKC